MLLDYNSKVQMLNNRCYNSFMNLKELQNKTILLFGKSRAFSDDEFLSQMKFHKVDVLSEYSERVSLVVEGKMMTPYEQIKSDELYKQYAPALEFISIDLFEREMGKYIDSNTLLMSLKLSRNKERLKSFIQNTTISDELFFKLLEMYSWGREDFFENDSNRDVSAAIILRFYKDIERNHNVQYATSGLIHLIAQTDSPKLIEAIAKLEPTRSNINILSIIASHPNTPKSVLENFIKSKDANIKRVVAMRDDCDEELQKMLFDDAKDSVIEALSYSKNLSLDIATKMIENNLYMQNIAKNIALNEVIFKLLLAGFSQVLALNSSLSFDMQKALVELNNIDIDINLASNSALCSEVLELLLKRNDTRVTLELYKNPITPKEILQEGYKNEPNHYALSQNPSTPHEILSALYYSADIDILRALAQNESTPIEVLYQLQLDSRVAKEVKQNPAFGKHIQIENIGWQI
ncbi:MAG: hypothetical protein QG559_1399 [Campylobacterota bacterium]|nr:hypothetical protein [Campylobacterota bacterium]